MKKTLLTIAAIMIVAYPVLAKMPKIDVGGEIRVRGEEKNNESDFKNTDKGVNDDKVSRVRTGVRLNLNSELSDGLAAHISLQHGDGKWGELGIFRPWRGGNNNIWDSSDEATGQSILEDTWVRHAYLTIDDLAGIVDLSIGRQAWGKQDYEMVFFSDELSAKVAKATLGNLSLIGLIGKMEETEIASDTDTNIYGLTASLENILGGIDLSGYGFQQITNASNNTEDDKNNVYGAKLCGSLDIASTLHYSAEYAKQGGTDTDTGQTRDASAYRVCLGYESDVEGLGGIAIEGSYLRGSGDGTSTTDKNEQFTGIAPNLDYYSKLVEEGGPSPFDDNKLLRDVKGLRPGLRAINVNMTIVPEAMDNVTLGISYTNFSSVEKVENKTGLGNELDLSCTYKYSDKTNLTFTYARFSPGDIYSPATDPATMLRCELLTNF